MVLKARQLLISTTAVVCGFVLLGVYGLVAEPLKLSQVLFALVFSGLFTLALDLPKYHIFRKLEL